MNDMTTDAIRIYLAEAKRNDFVCSEASLTEALATIREFWNEEAGPQTFLFIDPSGRTLATMTRLDADSEIAMTMHSNGTIEIHRCHYALNHNIERTEVTPMTLAELAAVRATGTTWTTEEIVNHAG